MTHTRARARARTHTHTHTHTHFFKKKVKKAPSTRSFQNQNRTIILSFKKAVVYIFSTKKKILGNDKSDTFSAHSIRNFVVLSTIANIK